MGWRVGSYCLMETKFRFCKMKRVLEMMEVIATKYECTYITDLYS